MPVNPSADADARVEAERSGSAFLRFRGAGGEQRLFFFAPGSTSASVGRHQSSDLVLAGDDQVSRLHARFERVGDAWDLEDDGLSRNGTFVNGERVSGRRRIGDGDTLRFGNTVAIFRHPKPQPAAVGLSTTQRRVLVALCRPYKERGAFAPAGDEQIAQELFLSVAEVSAHLRVLCAKLGMQNVSESEARLGLVERSLAGGLISERDL